MASEQKYETFPSYYLNMPARRVPDHDLGSRRIRGICNILLDAASGQNSDNPGDTRKMMGVAGPQLGIEEQVFIADTGADGGVWSGNYRTFINPRIIPTSQEVELDWEGCFSIPEIWGLVPRWESVRIEAFCPNAGLNDGYWVDEEFHGYVARILQHETDHLIGLGFPARLGSQDFRCVPSAEAKDFKSVRNKPEALGRWPALSDQDVAEIVEKCRPWA